MLCTKEALSWLRFELPEVLHARAESQTFLPVM